MLAALFVQFFTGAGPGGGGRKLPRFLVSTKKLRKAYDRLVETPAKAQAEQIAAPFIETVPADTSPGQPNFAMMARDEIAVELLLELVRRQDEEDAFALMLLGAV